MTRIDMWPVFDHGGFKLEGGRLRKRVAGMGGPSLVADGPARNIHLVGFLARRGDGTVLGRLTKGEVAAALGFGPDGWEAVVLHGVRLTDEEWLAARDTPDIGGPRDED